MSGLENSLRSNFVEKKNHQVSWGGLRQPSQLGPIPLSKERCTSTVIEPAIKNKSDIELISSGRCVSPVDCIYGKYRIFKFENNIYGEKLRIEY